MAYPPRSPSPPGPRPNRFGPQHYGNRGRVWVSPGPERDAGVPPSVFRWNWNAKGGANRQRSLL